MRTLATIARSALLRVLSAATWLVCAAVVAGWIPAMAVLVALTARVDRNRSVVSRFQRLGLVVIARSFPLWRFRVEGRWPADGRAYVVVANHSSHADILLLAHTPREMKWMAKIDAFRIPGLGWTMRLAGDLPVWPGSPGEGLRTLARATAYLRRGMSVLVFPEGRRNGGALLRFRSGAFRLALQSGTPVLPLALIGTEVAMRAGEWVLRPAEIAARILEPVEVTGLGERDVGRLRDEVRARIDAAIRAEARRPSEGGVPAVAC